MTISAPLQGIRNQHAVSEQAEANALAFDQPQSDRVPQQATQDARIGTSTTSHPKPWAHFVAGGFVAHTSREFHC